MVTYSPYLIVEEDRERRAEDAKLGSEQSFPFIVISNDFDIVYPPFLVVPVTFTVMVVSVCPSLPFFIVTV